MPDAATGEREEHRVAGRVVPDLPDQLDLGAGGRGGPRDSRGEPARIGCGVGHRPGHERWRTHDGEHAISLAGAPPSPVGWIGGRYPPPEPPPYPGVAWDDSLGPGVSGASGVWVGSALERGVPVELAA